MSGLILGGVEVFLIICEVLSSSFVYCDFISPLKSICWRLVLLMEKATSSPWTKDLIAGTGHSR